MSIEQDLGYEWRDSNPSEEIALSVILSALFEEDGMCEWMAERTYENEASLTVAENLLRSQYPHLFGQLELLEHTQAGNIFHMLEHPEIADHYYRGATIALLALHASQSPTYEHHDLSKQYLRRFSQLDGIDQERWLIENFDYNKKHTEALRLFILNDYTEGMDVPALELGAMLVGARYAYILTTHFDACYRREVEISWLTRDQESFKGWLAYRQGDYA